jgi:hypothetical protein
MNLVIIFLGRGEYHLPRLVCQARQKIGMQGKIKFTLTADQQYTALEEAPSMAALFEQVGRPSVILKSTHTIQAFIRTSSPRWRERRKDI